jgi:cytochrome c oxidase subunit 2
MFRRFGNMKRHLTALITLVGISFIACAAAIKAEDAQVIKITAKCYAFTPNEIKLKKGVPVTLHLTTADKTHGFSAPDFNLDTAIKPGKTIDLHITPDKAGSFPFYCDVFCGTGHDDMTGKIIVTD